MKRRSGVLLFGVLMSVPVSLALVANTFFGPQSHDEQARELHAAARVSLSQGRWKEAVERLRLARKLSPNDLEIHRLYQNTQRAHGREKEVVDEYRALRDGTPDSSFFHYLYGRLLPAEELRKEMQRAIELDEKNAPAHATIGLSFFDAGDYARCLDPLRTAFALRREKSWLNSMAEAQLRLGDPAAATATWEQFNRDFPGSHEGWYGLGAALQLAGLHREAAEKYREALKAAPRVRNIHAALFRCLHEARDWTGIRSFVRQSRSTPPQETVEALEPFPQPAPAPIEARFTFEGLEFTGRLTPMREHSSVEFSSVRKPQGPEGVRARVGEAKAGFVLLLSVPGEEGERIVFTWPDELPVYETILLKIVETFPK